MHKKLVLLKNFLIRNQKLSWLYFLWTHLHVLSYWHFEIDFTSALKTLTFFPVTFLFHFKLAFSRYNNLLPAMLIKVDDTFTRFCMHISKQTYIHASYLLHLLHIFYISLVIVMTVSAHFYRLPIVHTSQYVRYFTEGS